ncbi:MAG: hypothetical protein GY699_11765 [Desulfobacteraceae bacterium]|nr:hypothetical protein [Desulfobacteraceae bacterium]
MNSLTELKKITQSLNEKITDHDIASFQNELLRLGEKFKDDQSLTTFFDMLQSLSNYLGSKKNNAHTDSISILNSITAQVEKIINRPDLKLAEINKILSTEIQKFKSLKNSITSATVINAKDIRALKEVILSIDWEISETTVQNFKTVVTRLLSKAKGHKLHHAFLKIIYNLGRYIGIQKANAHTDSIPFLHSIFENFERIVETPSMSFNDKKQMIEAEIKRFNEFKLKISKKKVKTPPPENFSDDDQIQPALSHVKQSDINTSDDLIPLTELSEQDNLLAQSNELDREAVEPALVNKQKFQPGSQDVMDDLFNIKESPADELLDAIHLMDVHGPNQGQAMNMMDQTRDSQSKDVKNVTAERLDNDPIPEIGNRLDEFFNLETKKQASVEPDDTPTQETEIKPPENQEDQDQLEGIIPFEYEDDSIEESQSETNTVTSTPHPTDTEILSSLKSTIEKLESPHNAASLLLINENISTLKNRWQNDTQKISLLEILFSAINTGKDTTEINLPENENIMNNKEIEPGSQPVEPTGIWEKIKGMFTS